MKKIQVLLAFILYTALLFSQTRETVIVTDLNTQLQSNFNSEWISDLVDYRKSMGSQCYTSDALLDLARKKAYYFASVLDESSGEDKFKNCIKNIPYDASAHTELFGNPSKFKNSRGVKFPLTDRSMTVDQKIERSGEIMQEMTYFKKEDTKLSDGEIIDMMLTAFEDKLGESQFIQRYLNSPSHKRTIDMKDSNLFGSSMVFVIHRWYDEKDSKWAHDVLLINVTEFGARKSGRLATKKSLEGSF